MMKRFFNTLMYALREFFENMHLYTEERPQTAAEALRTNKFASSLGVVHISVHRINNGYLIEYLPGTPALSSKVDRKFVLAANAEELMPNITAILIEAKLNQ